MQCGGVEVDGGSVAIRPSPSASRRSVPPSILVPATADLPPSSHRIVQDLRYALRTLGRNPVYALAAVLTLALGLGATTAVFALARGILLEALPYAHADRLVEVFEQNPQGSIRPLSYPTFQDWRETVANAVDGFAFVFGVAPLMPSPDGPTPVLTAFVSGGFFHTLGVTPMLGRLITGAEEPADAGVVVASYDFWKEDLGGDPAAIGRTIVLDDRTFVVVGVTPREVGYPSWARVWAPLNALSEAGRRAVARRDRHADGAVVARLAPDRSLPSAAQAFARAAERQAAAYPETGAGWTAVQVTRLRDLILGNASQRLTVLAATVLLVLALACVNVMGLTLVRVTARSRELAVRAALGAGRFQVIRLLGIESLVVALVGAALGVGVAVATTRYLRAAAPAFLPRLANVRVGIDTLGVGIMLAVIVAVVLAVGPGWAATRGGARGVLGGVRAGGATRGSSRVRSALVAVQLAVALALLAGTGLLVRTLVALGDVSPGFDPDRLLSVRIQPPATRYDDPEHLVGLYRQLEEAAAAVPGVTAAALSNHLPIGGSWMPTPIEIAGRTSATAPEYALFRTISPTYFATMRIPLVGGRAFLAGDLTGEPVAIVNRTLARRYWPSEDPLGQSLTVHRSVQGRSDFGQPERLRVVGIVGDVHHLGVDQPVMPEVYLPYVVNPPTWIQLAVRVRDEPSSVIHALRERFASIEPLLPLGDAFDTLQNRLARGRAPRAFMTQVVSAFATLALLLAAVGVWGITAYTVARRRFEIGVRVALGANAARLPVSLVVAILPVVVSALGGGLVAALVLGRVMRSQLFGVAASDPVALAAAAVLLVAVTLVATYLPARRAAKVDPAAVLRAE
jgi:putative ABC transport system permease protein